MEAFLLKIKRKDTPLLLSVKRRKVREANRLPRGAVRKARAARHGTLMPVPGGALRFNQEKPGSRTGEGPGPYKSKNGGKMPALQKGTGQVPPL